MIVFCFLSGYLNTMVYYCLLKKITPGGKWSCEFLSRWFALISQIGAALGSGISLICIFNALYFEDSDDDDMHYDVSVYY